MKKSLSLITALTLITSSCMPPIQSSINNITNQNKNNKSFGIKASQTSEGYNENGNNRIRKVSK